MAKKRTQAAAGIRTGGRDDKVRGGRKRRKAAEASKAKTRRMVYDESDDEDEDASSLPDLPGTDARTNGQARESNVEELPLIAPGLRLWEGFADTVPGTDIAALAKMNADGAGGAENVGLSRKYGFSLQPLIVTEGPLAGEQVLVLKRTAAFRFLDLPAEIRNIVYSHVLSERNNEIHIRSYNPRGQNAKRPVRWGFIPGTDGTRRGLAYDHATNKWIEGEPSSLAVLRVCKQIFAEAAPIVYGGNTFVFWDLGDADLFLERIGSMRRLVRRVESAIDGYRITHVASIFKMLRDATDLRAIRFHHATLCQERRSYYRGVTPEVLAKQVAPLLSAIRRRAAREGREPAVDVRDIVQVVGYDDKECRQCSLGKAHECNGWQGCSTKCADRGAHREDLQERVREAIGEVLGMEE